MSLIDDMEKEFHHEPKETSKSGEKRSFSEAELLEAQCTCNFCDVARDEALKLSKTRWSLSWEQEHFKENFKRDRYFNTKNCLKIGDELTLRYNNIDGYPPSQMIVYKAKVVVRTLLSIYHTVPYFYLYLILSCFVSFVYRKYTKLTRGLKYNSGKVLTIPMVN